MAREIKAIDLVGELGVNRGTFDSWVARGHLDEAIIRRANKKCRSNIFDFDKAKILVEALLTNADNGMKTAPEVSEYRITTSKSKSVKEAYMAKLVKLDYEERIKKVVNTDDVKRIFFSSARVLRNSLLSIPGRIAGELLGVTDDKEIEAILTKQIVDVLEDMQKIELG